LYACTAHTVENNMENYPDISVSKIERDRVFDVHKEHLSHLRGIARILVIYRDILIDLSLPQPV